MSIESIKQIVNKVYTNAIILQPDTSQGRQFVVEYRNFLRLVESFERSLTERNIDRCFSLIPQIAKAIKDFFLTCNQELNLGINQSRVNSLVSIINSELERVNSSTQQPNQDEDEEHTDQSTSNPQSDQNQQQPQAQNQNRAQRGFGANLGQPRQSPQTQNQNQGQQNQSQQGSQTQSSSQSQNREEQRRIRRGFGAN